MQYRSRERSPITFRDLIRDRLDGAALTLDEKPDSPLREADDEHPVGLPVRFELFHRELVEREYGNPEARSHYMPAARLPCRLNRINAEYRIDPMARYG